MTEYLLTNEGFLKSIMNISDNVAPKYLLPAIREAQEGRLRSILGDTLIEALKAQASAGSIVPPYDELLMRCQYVIAYTAAARVIPKVTFKIGNFGLVKTSDENQQVVTSQEMDKIVAEYVAEADCAALDLQNYLLNNRSDFPELTEGDAFRIKSNLYSHASCGIWLGGARGKMIRRTCR